MQSTSHLLMIRPAAFGFNAQTAGSNAFQAAHTEQSLVRRQALAEFDAMVHLLRSKDIDVVVIEDTTEPLKPDAIFPNNWVSFHETGDVLLYPMQAENRRLERREDVIRKLKDRFTVRHVIDLSRFELEQQFLEGTGSLVLDRENKLAFACLSPRTDQEVLQEFCRFAGYAPVPFRAVDEQGQAIYHTNVLMCLGSRYAVICLEAIADDAERRQVTDWLHQTGKRIVNISFAQLRHFAGNMLEVRDRFGKAFLVMSEQAYRSLTAEQIALLEPEAELLHTNLQTIETNGGGSARCMMAEVFLPLKE